MSTAKLSFTVRRPSPESRGNTPASDSSTSFKIPAIPKHLSASSTHDSTPLGSPLARSAASSPRAVPERRERRDDYDSSDEDDEVQDELVTGFDKFGVQRCVHFLERPQQWCQLTKGLNHDFRVFEKKAKEGPLVIPALKNKDWRELARKRRSKGQFVPDSAAAKTGADGSVGGLGTRETINSGPVLSGLQVRKRESRMETDEDEDEDVTMADEAETAEPETEEQKALRALLAEASGEHKEESTFVIPTPISETDALKQDVEELPDVATLDDYERVPVSQFGAAMLRGMGWKEGQAASRKGKGLVEPYIPAARPALLGIGAKEQEVFDDGSKSKYKSKRPERRYVPIVKKDKEGSSEAQDSRKRSRSPPRSSTRSRQASRSPDRREKSRYDRDDDSKRRRERDGEYASRDRDRDRKRDRDRNGDEDYRRGQDADRDRRDRDREPDRDRDRTKDRRRDYERDDRRDSSRRSERRVY